MYIYICMYVVYTILCVYIYLYIYRERDRPMANVWLFELQPGYWVTASKHHPLS